MLLVQAKASKKGGILVVDGAGEMHPCLEPGELWSVLTELGKNEGNQNGAELQPVPEALLLRIKIRRNALVIIDPLAEMHHCTDEHDLWDTIADLIENDDVPRAVGAALLPRDADGVAPHEDIPTVRDDSEDFRPSEVREVIEEMVGDAAAELGAGLFKRLRSLSHRGAAPKPGSRVPKKRVKRGDIY